jgi:signal transduction histidine kinase
MSTPETPHDERIRSLEQSIGFAEQFIGILSHDLRNPLDAIGAAAGLLKLRAKDESDRALANRIATSVDRMNGMVSQLLDFSRDRLAGGIPITRTRVDARSVVAAAVDELRQVHPALDLRFDRSAAAQGDWDAQRLRQVVLNLVANAIEYGHAAWPIDVFLEVSDEQLVLEIHNEGEPISTQALPHVFDPYRRSAVPPARTPGLGLGVFIARQIVVAHGGTIEIRSSAKAGTTFSVRLPRFVPPAAS